MKFLRINFYVLLFSVLCLSAYSQDNLQQMADRLQVFGERLPQEQVYVHLDNTSYYLGDTIFYKAYVARGDNGMPTNFSGILYCELLNDDGYLVERQMVSLDKGEGYGNFAITDTALYAGYYELRAYTRWQLNWGTTEQAHGKWAEDYFFNKDMAKDYYRDYDKLYSRVFPVYNRPLSPGDYSPEMTLRPLAAYYKNPAEVPHTSVQFYPEGGDLVGGVNQRVAWEVRNELGVALEGALCVRLSNGDSIVSETLNRGRGIFELPSSATHPKEAVFVPKPRSSNPANAQKSTVHLPSPVKDGVALCVTSDTNCINISYQASGQASLDTLGLTIMRNGVLKHFRHLQSDTIQYHTNEVGVYQVTVFNSEGRVYADRLCFLLPGDFRPNTIGLNGLKENNYDAYEPVLFEIEGEPGSSLSVAVRDAARSEYVYDTGSMLTETLLSSQIKGFVPHPQWFFEKDDAERRQALDLLMMVQGWRRYSWKEMALPHQFVLQHMPEGRYPHWKGQLHNYSAKQVLSVNEQRMQEFNDAASKDVSTNDSEDDNSSTEETTASDGSTSQMLSEEDSNDSRSRFNKKEAALKYPVVLHAEFSQPGNQGVTGEMYSQGVFSIDFPRYYGEFFFFLAASDSTKWKKGVLPIWTQTGRSNHDEVEFPEYYVKLDPIHPRFPKPYDYYQSHVAPMPRNYPLYNSANENVRMLSEVTVGARNDGRRRFGHWRPAFIIDAYEAFNATCEAGFIPGYFPGSARFCEDVARTYIGDMKTDRRYDVIVRYDGVTFTEHSAAQLKKRDTTGKTSMSPIPSSTTFINDNTRDKYNYLWNLSDVVVYTDYSPRKDGHNKYKGNDLPSVTVDLKLLEGDGQRSYQKNRRWKMHGFSVPDEFYSPDYSKMPLPPHDYRRTLYWSPSVKLDENGKAVIRLYNNSSSSLLQVQVEGWSPEGTPQSAKVN